MNQSLAVRNAKLNALEAAIGASPILRFYTGPMPVSTSAARTGTLVSSMVLAADWLADAANGAKAKLGNWQDASTAAAGLVGYATWFAADGTTPHIQVRVSEPWAASKAYLVNQQAHINGLVYRATAAGTSAASGGPTGTGAAITDGGVTWAYVGVVEMTMNNTNINAGQALSVDNWTFTDGNG